MQYRTDVTCVYNGSLFYTCCNNVTVVTDPSVWSIFVYTNCVCVIRTCIRHGPPYILRCYYSSRSI